MEVETKAFRSVLVGGFSKEDVNSYIENMAKKNNEETEKLRKELESSRSEAENLKKKAADAEKSAEEKCREAEEKLSEKERELEYLRSEMSEVSARVDSLSKVESEYAGRKEKLADIEIAARARADEIIAAAEADAEEGRRALERELAERERAFEVKKAQMLRETSDALSNLARIYTALKADVDTVDARISRITDSVRDGTISLVSACAAAQDKLSDLRAAIAEEEYSE